jgi:adenylate cyclase
MAGMNRVPRIRAVFVLVVFSVTVTYFLSRLAFFEILELKTVDYRFRLLGSQSTASHDIVIFEIDDTSLKSLEDYFGRWPWPREAHAVFLRFMKQAGARVIAYDVLFLGSDLSNPESDAGFVRETAELNNVVNSLFLGDQENEQVKQVSPELLAQVSIDRVEGVIDFPEIDVPFSGLVQSSQALGHVANVLDPDGPFRNYLPLANYKDRTIPSLALAVAAASQGLSIQEIQADGNSISIGTIQCPLDENLRLPIWFNGGPGTYESIPYAYAIYSQAQIEAGETPELNPERFRDKIVLVGATGAGLYDMFTTPFSGFADEQAQVEGGVQLGKMSGVEVHANVIDNLLHHRFLKKLPETFNVLIGLLVSLLALTTILYSPLWIGLTGVLLLLGTYLGLAHLAFSHYLQIPVAPTVSGWILTVMLGFGYQYWVEGAEKRKVKAIFSRYVSKDIYRQLLENPEAAQLGGTRRFATVLFSDLRGFTSMSENRQPEDIVAQLNEYFTAMVEVVFQHEGTVDKFVGDMIMALFGAPLPDEHHADHAVQCAVAMQKRLRQLNDAWKEQGLPQLACGVGINTGEMIAGNVGAETIFSYTVIGDNVNLGSRLESLCKQYTVGIIISEFTRGLLKQDYVLQDLGEVVVKGKSKPVEIFEVCSEDSGTRSPDVVMNAVPQPNQSLKDG